MNRLSPRAAQAAALKRARQYLRLRRRYGLYEAMVEATE